jgi:hypothetical protein
MSEQAANKRVIVCNYAEPTGTNVKGAKAYVCWPWRGGGNAAAVGGGRSRS